MSPSYSERHLDPVQAQAYREKHDKSLLRRMSSRRERAILRAALALAVERLPAVLPDDAAPTLLDFPCGAGRFASMFARVAKTYVPGDHSPHMLALTRHELTASGLADRVQEWIQADARSMPLADQSVDLACCIRLLHHFQAPRDQQRILREFRRVCRGPLVLTFLDANAPKQWMHLRRHDLARTKSRRALLSIDGLRAVARATGYELVRTWSLSRWFSGQSVALLDVTEPTV